MGAGLQGTAETSVPGRASAGVWGLGLGEEQTQSSFQGGLQGRDRGRAQLACGSNTVVGLQAVDKVKARTTAGQGWQLSRGSIGCPAKSRGTARLSCVGHLKCLHGGLHSTTDRFASLSDRPGVMCIHM